MDLKFHVGILSRASLTTLGATILISTSSFAAKIDPRPVTFSKDIAPIFQAKCEECHRKGTVAPMSLVTYQEARPWAKAIRERVLNRQMPPWHLDKTVGIQHFANDRSLSDAEIDTIVRWVDAGAPMGDPKDMPPAIRWPTEETWQLAKMFGEPDLILKSEPYTMPSQGQDVWWKPSTPIPIDEPRWVRAVEMRPGSLAGRRITHHSLARLEQEEPGATNADDDPAAGPGLLMEWAIGKQFDIYRPNTGKLLLPGSQIRWDIHLHAVGETIRDHVELAVYLYPKGVVPKYRTRLVAFGAIPRLAGGQNGLDIPPNSISETQNLIVLKEPARLENFQPHMHLRGKAMSLEAILPNGTIKMLSYVNNFNFNWMNNYIYADDDAPVLPKGAMVRVTAWHDNTTKNPNNPNPDEWVGYGDRTVDEMAHAWVNVTYISEEDYKAEMAKRKAREPKVASAEGEKKVDQASQ
ncbi:MAG TPA: cytochrome c [Bryobacteraceae bacterium]|nr:cytochrome c [Bryobacteraceae bacterium]